MITTNLFAKMFEVRTITIDGKKVEYSAHPQLGTATERLVKEDGKPDRTDPLGWAPLSLVVFSDGKISWNWYNSQTRKNVRREFTVQSMNVKDTSQGKALLVVAGNRKFGLVVTQRDDLWEMKLNALVGSFTPAGKEETQPAVAPPVAPAKPAAKKARAKKQLVPVAVAPASDPVESQIDEFQNMMEETPF